jgi:signal transduction histidine kinase
VLALVALLVGLSVGGSLIVARHFRQDAISTSRIYSRLYEGLLSGRPGAEAEALFSLSEMVTRSGIPLIVTDGMGNVTAAENLPFDVPLDDPRVLEFARELDARNVPVREGVNVIHYGPIPAVRQLTALAILQAFTIATMVAVGAFAYRSAMMAQRDRLWVAMAREAAHQMGTPLTSLQGWIEQVRSRPTPPEGLADYLSADAERLDRVAKRFERIGNPAHRDPVALGAMADRIAGYFRPRLPRHANAIELKVEAAGPGPDVEGDPILLEWALESLVKNAIDALKGRPGTIVLRVDSDETKATLRVIDDGPGVPKDSRRDIFQPGTSTKEGGWGIGLALARRVVQENHGGSLTLEPTDPGSSGASFKITLPLIGAEST